MADLLGDIFSPDTWFGQQELAKQNALDPAQQLAAAQGLLPQIGALNQQVAQNQLALVPYQNQIRGALYGQAINPLQSTYTQSILDNLNRGNVLPQDVVDDLNRKSAEVNSMTGFRGSQGGINNSLRNLGIGSLQYGAANRAEALGTLQAFRPPEIQGQFSPQTAIDFQMASFNDANNQLAAEAANRNANRGAIKSSAEGYAKLGGAVAGEFVGSALGTKGYGSVLSGIGGSMGGGGGGGGGVQPNTFDAANNYNFNYQPMRLGP